jgi:hypothetical protein
MMKSLRLPAALMTSTITDDSAVSKTSPSNVGRILITNGFCHSQSTAPMASTLSNNMDVNDNGEDDVRAAVLAVAVDATGQRYMATTKTMICRRPTTVTSKDKSTMTVTSNSNDCDEVNVR